MGTLGGLFRSSLFAGFLERLAHSPDDVKAMLVVEGETDRAWLKPGPSEQGALTCSTGCASWPQVTASATGSKAALRSASCRRWC